MRSSTLGDTTPYAPHALAPAVGRIGFVCFGCFGRRPKKQSVSNFVGALHILLERDFRSQLSELPDDECCQCGEE